MALEHFHRVVGLINNVRNRNFYFYRDVFCQHLRERGGRYKFDEMNTPQMKFGHLTYLFGVDFITSIVYPEDRDGDKWDFLIIRI